MDIRRNFSSHRDSYFNLLLGLYMAFIVLFPDSYDRWFRDPLLDQSDMVFRSIGGNAFFGVLLLVLQIVEFIGLKWKSDAVFYRIRDATASESSDLGLFLLWLFHAVVSTMLGLIAFQSFGLNIDTHQNWPMALIFAIVIKELALLVLVICRQELKLPRPALPVWKETVADLFLLLFNAVVYTTIWEFLAFDPATSMATLRADPPMFFIAGAGILLIFCMTILPLKIPWLTELWYTAKFDRKTAASLMSLLSIAVVAFTPLVIGHIDLYDALNEPGQATRLFLTNFPERRLPPDIAQLQRLNILYVQRGVLETLPPEIGELKALRYLSIESTLISSIPKEIGNLEDLRKLSLHHNQLTSIPVEIRHLENLRLLDLSDNRLRTIPLGIQSLQNLRELKLSGNPLPKNAVETLRKEMPHTKIVF